MFIPYSVLRIDFHNFKVVGCQIDFDLCSSCCSIAPSILTKNFKSPSCVKNQRNRATLEIFVIPRIISAIRISVSEKI